MKERTPSTITRAQYLQLLGLVTLGERLVKQTDEIRSAMAEIVDERDEDGSIDASGHISDVIWGGRGLDQALHILKITVADSPPAEPQA